MNSTPTTVPTSSRLSTNDASRYAGVPVSTLRYWRHNGTGPASYSIGVRVFYDLADLDDWIAAQKAATLRGGVA